MTSPEMFGNTREREKEREEREREREDHTTCNNRETKLTGSVRERTKYRLFHVCGKTESDFREEQKVKVNKGGTKILLPSCYLPAYQNRYTILYKIGGIRYIVSCFCNCCTLPRLACTIYADSITLLGFLTTNSLSNGGVL